MTKEKILIVEDEFIVAHNLQRTLEKAGFYVIGIADSVKKALALLELAHADFVLLDIYLKGKQTGIDLARHLLKLQIPFIYISANSNEKVMDAAKHTHPYGFIVKPYREKDVLLSIDIARVRHQYHVNFKVSTEHYLRSILEGVAQSDTGDNQKLLKAVSAFQPFIPFDLVSMICRDQDNVKGCNFLNILRLDFDQYEVVDLKELINGEAIAKENADHDDGFLDAHPDAIYLADNFDETTENGRFKKKIAEKLGLNSNLDKTFTLQNQSEVTFSFFSRIYDIYRREHQELLSFLHETLVVNLEGMLSFKKAKILSGSSDGLNYKTDADVGFKGIVGNSPLLLNMLDRIRIVAPADTSVLITGESGTGKELVALNLHALSGRRNKPITIVNCAALPADLIESILFGHEKGSFTGADETKIGKFEEANGGTIFLDEIGEMPLEAQAKLLRVLQEMEVERIGGKRVIQVDVRVIAATNRILEKEIAANRFRIDLYYRLNVFPIHIPALRERRADIPVLIEHFTGYYSKKFHKHIKGLKPDVASELTSYHWPGNIRELMNVMERGILLTKGDLIEGSLLEEFHVIKVDEEHGNQTIKTIAENERDHILKVLLKCNGRISGEGGAAELLGVPATTLNSKLKKLGIRR